MAADQQGGFDLIQPTFGDVGKDEARIFCGHMLREVHPTLPICGADPRADQAQLVPHSYDRIAAGQSRAIDPGGGFTVDPDDPYAGLYYSPDRTPTTPDSLTDTPTYSPNLYITTPGGEEEEFDETGVEKAGNVVIWVGSIADRFKPQSTRGFAFAVLCADAQAIWLLILALRKLQLPVAWVIVYAWSPVLLKEAYCTMAVDAFVMPALVG